MRLPKSPSMPDRGPGEPPRDDAVFGQRVRSDLPLPELFEEQGSGEPDAVVHSGAIAAAEEESGLAAVTEGLLLTVPDVARYQISEGRSIRVEALEGADPRNVRLFLLGSAFGALIHQRGLLPLHANAIEIRGKAVAFMGESGSGKSTLAALFHDRRFRVLADDVCVVRSADDGRSYVAAGLPRLRLWRDALELTRRAPEQFQRSYAGETAYEKFDVPTGTNATADGDRELGAVFELSRGEVLRFDRLNGVDLMDTVYAHTYRGEFLSTVNGEHSHWSAAVRLARSVPFYRMTRPWDLARLESEFAAIVEFVETQLTRPR
jgi:hypothetical protein